MRRLSNTSGSQCDCLELLFKFIEEVTLYRDTDIVEAPSSKFESDLHHMERAFNDIRYNKANIYRNHFVLHRTLFEA